MAKPYGGAELSRRFEILRKALEDYYGALAQRANGLNVEIPEKPVILVYLDQFLITNKLLNDGGLGDQPYIFMQEFKIAYDREKLHKMLTVKSKAEKSNA